MTQRTQKIFLEDILHSIEKIERYTAHLRFEDFETNEIIVDAVIRNLEIIGEASKSIHPSLRSAHPEIPWRQIIGFRNIAIHEYFWLELSIIWDVLMNDVPRLKNTLLSMLQDESIE